METHDKKDDRLLVEARELLKSPAHRQKKASNTCSACGLEHSRNHKGLNATIAPVHTLVEQKNHLKAVETLKRAMDSDAVDFVRKEQFREELIRLEAELHTAQMEHAAYEKPVPTPAPLGLTVCGKCRGGVRTGNTIHCACGVRVIDSMEDDMLSMARLLKVEVSFNDEGEPNLRTLASRLRRTLESSVIE